VVAGVGLVAEGVDRQSRLGCPVRVLHGYGNGDRDGHCGCCTAGQAAVILGPAPELGAAVIGAEGKCRATVRILLRKAPTPVGVVY